LKKILTDILFVNDARQSNQIKSNQFISETADSKIEIHDNDNVQPLTEARKGCCQR